MSTKRLTGKVALIAGSASGIGAAIAKRFAEEDAIVVMTDKNKEKGEAVCKDIGAAEFITADFRYREEVKAVVEETEKKYKKLDIFVNSVGMMFSKDFMECTEEDWWNVMDTNVFTQLNGMWEVIPAMQKSGKGSIINIAGKLGSSRPNDKEAFYTYASAALTHVTKCIQLVHAKENIRMNVLAPGFAATEQITNSERAKKFIPSIPLGRFADPEEIANAALFLASVDSSYVSGLCMQVDGGFVSGDNVTAED